MTKLFLIDPKKKNPLGGWLPRGYETKLETIGAANTLSVIKNRSLLVQPVGFPEWLAP
jgi:hypothetical protein